MTLDPRDPTLDQLRVLVEVADAGSFTAAARRMSRAISVVSYAIGNLESQLGVALFDRETARRPQLTQAGRIVLAEARSVIGGVSRLRSKVKGMLGGLEGELAVALDSLLPAERMVDALTGFSAAFPTVVLRVHVETLGGVASLVLDKAATIGISGPFATDTADLDRISVGSLRMLPVAGPGHPLAANVAGGHPAGSARDHVQLVIYDRSPLTRGRDFNVSANLTWRLADLAAKHMLLKAGVGWGMMPLTMVADDLRARRLVALDLPDVPGFDYLLDAVHRGDTPPGPAASWLIRRFREQAGQEPRATFE